MTDKPKHTPGPWKWDNKQPTLDDSEHMYDGLYGFGWESVLVPDMLVSRDTAIVSIGEADAALIAASPDMCEALEKIKKESNVSQTASGNVMCCQFNRIQEIACAALAKVRENNDQENG